MKKLVVLTGAGISAESGIKTFRDSGGLWEEHSIEEVATPQAFERNPEMVLDFYNQRRKQLHEVEPNKGHKALANLEKYFDVTIITQNVDDLHERAGSSNVIHLHGELKKAQSSGNPKLVYEIEGYEIKMGDKCEQGYQLRPHVVWFGEAVPKMEVAARVASQAEIFIVTGTSLNVYPAAGLVNYAPAEAPKFLVDPADCPVAGIPNIEVIKEKAGTGLSKLAERLVGEFA